MKTWNMRKKKEAVSPVIATILMVAITVVLAAVLYVMVMGFGGDTETAPTASLTQDGNKLVLSISESQVNGTAGTLLIKVGTGAPTSLGFGTVATGLTFVDAGGDGKISNGDYFTRTSGTPVTITILYKSGDTNIPLAEGTI